MSNNDANIDLFLNKAFVHGVLMAQPSIPAFAIPLVRPHRGSNLDYTPTVNAMGLIDGFMPVVAEGIILNIPDKYHIEIGQDEVFGLVDPDGNPLIGTRKSLQPRVRRWIDRVEDRVCQLNMSLFCDFEKLSISLGKQVFTQKTSELGDRDAAARWFASAFTCIPMCREVAKILYARTMNWEEDRFGDISPKIQTGNKSVRIDFPHEILELDDKSQNEFMKRFAEIVSFSERSTGYSFYYGPFARFRSKGKSRYSEASDTVVTSIDIGKYERQERRLAEILNEYIRDELGGLRLFLDYTDSAKYVNKALSILKSLEKDKNRDQSGRVARIASLIPNLTRAAFPQQRGVLLFELARVLGKYPEIGAMIIRQASQSNQREVLEVRSAIQDFVTTS